MPESESFYSVLVHNRDSLDRVRRLIVAGPVLVSTLKTSVELTELLLSGELEEGDLAPETRIGRLSPEADLRDVASAYHFAHARHLAEWVLNPTFDPSHGLCRLADGLIRFLLARLQGEIEVIALGSYGTLELGPASDLDLLFLAPPDVAQPDAESQAQRFLSKLSEVRRLGAPVSFDLRLRPDGGKGLLARSHGALRQYARHDMEWWERFALGHARLVHGTPEAIRLVREVAFGDVPDEVAISELLRMKRRIETERVQPQHVRRNVKLGFGGLTDIEWTIRMSELSSGGFVPDVFSTRAEDRMNELVRRQLLTTIEKDALIEAHRFLLRLRFCLHLQGHADDLLPENPHRLDRLAAVLGMQSGNVLLARYQEITQTVRSLFLESVERLRR
jgi:glutamate-ammonia-ligase adenylyltransferase